MRFINGMLASAGTLATLAMGMGVVNFVARSAATRRLAEHGDDLNAEAALILW